MKALIPAAGMGTRLGELTSETNKCLLKVGDRPIIEHLINMLKSSGIDDIVVATGYFADKVEDALKGRAECVYNDLYDKAGILYSVQKGSPRLRDDSFIYVTSDAMLHKDILTECIKAEGEIVVVVKINECDAEGSKVQVKDDEIIKMGKDVPSDEATGEFLMMKVSQSVSPAFFDEVDSMLNEGKINGRVMDIIMRLKAKGVRVVPMCTDKPALEIDDNTELEEARKIFR
ncbi:MAG: NTP transferase domain-containing protein [Candidatus Omnitrophica bacterium]|nr:NTP transferase domain-containing protein [Candidatus Omnitrophota bacterium]